MKLTPMLEQYLRVKAERPDALLFFRLGDFYEMFFEDAETAARVLDLTLTTRSQEATRCRSRCAACRTTRCRPYVARLLGAGLKVAICDRCEDASAGQGLRRARAWCA